MTGQELEKAVQALGMTLTEVAEDVNRLSGLKLSVSDLSRMKRGEANGGRDPSPPVVLYLNMRLEQRKAEERDPVRQLARDLEKAGLRVVRAGMPPGFMMREKE